MLWLPDTHQGKIPGCPLCYCWSLITPLKIVVKWMARTLNYFKAKGKEGDVIGPWETASVFCSLSEERLWL